MDVPWVTLTVLSFWAIVLMRQLHSMLTTTNIILEKIRFATVALCEIQDEMRTLERVRDIQGIKIKTDPLPAGLHDAAAPVTNSHCGWTQGRIIALRLGWPQRGGVPRPALITDSPKGVGSLECRWDLSVVARVLGADQPAFIPGGFEFFEPDDL